MIFKRYAAISTVLIALFLVSLQSTGQEASVITALKLFDKENYGEAEKILELLLSKEPDNTMLNYYYGASRTENGNYSDTDLNHLLKAGKTVTPHRINYYLGIQYHAKSEWEQALSYYNRFRISVPEKEQQALKINEMIQQCYDKVNPFSTTSFEKPELPADTVPQVISPPAVQPETANKTPEYSEPATTPSGNHEKEKKEQLGISRRALPDLPGVKPTVALPEGEFIEFQINNSVTYLHTSHFRTDKGKELFSRARSMQSKLDKSLMQTEMLRKEYRESDDGDMKKTIGQEIISLESEIYVMQDIIRKLRQECRETENEYWQEANNTEINNFTVELNKIKALKEGSYSEVMATDTKNDEPVIIITPSELLTTPGTVTGKVKSSGLIYKIEIGAYSRGVPTHIKRLYNKLEMLRKIENYTDENGVVVYTTGNLTNLEDAIKMRDQVRQEGIKDARVVPYFQEKRITLEQAKEIETGK